MRYRVFTIWIMENKENKIYYDYVTRNNLSYDVRMILYDQNTIHIKINIYPPNWKHMFSFTTPMHSPFETVMMDWKNGISSPVRLQQSQKVASQHYHHR